MRMSCVCVSSGCNREARLARSFVIATLSRLNCRTKPEHKQVSNRGSSITAGMHACLSLPATATRAKLIENNFSNQVSDTHQLLRFRGEDERVDTFSLVRLSFFS